MLSEIQRGDSALVPKVGEVFNPAQKWSGIYIVNPILQYKGLSPGAKLVWGRLYRFSGEDGRIFPAVNTVAEDIGLSDKQARRYIHELVEDGFLKVISNPGYTNHYAFIWHPAYDGDRGEPKSPLPDQGAPTPPASGSTPPPASGRGTPPASGSTPLPHQGGEREELREEISREENLFAVKEKNSLSLSENLSLSDNSLSISPKISSFVPVADELQTEEPINEFVKNVYRQKRGAKLPSPGEFRNHWVQKLLDEESRHGMEEFRTALIGYLARSDDWVRQNKWPLPAFLKDPMRYLDIGVSELQDRSAASEGIQVAGSGSDASEGPEIANTASNTQQVPGHLQYVDRWNTLIPERAIRKLLRVTEKKLQRMTSDVDFTENFETVLQKCRRMISARPEEEFPNFQWLFAETQKGFNWIRVLEGAYDWAMTDNNKPKKSPRDEQYERMMKWAESGGEITA